MRVLDPNDASILALMAQYQSAPPVKRRELERLLGPEGKKVAKAMLATDSTFSRKKSEQVESKATLTAKALKSWASSNRFSVQRPKANLPAKSAPGIAYFKVLVGDKGRDLIIGDETPARAGSRRPSANAKGKVGRNSSRSSARRYRRDRA